MFIRKFILKILLLPVLLVTFVLRFIINVLLHIGSFGVSGMFMIGLYAIVMGFANKNWQLIFIMSIALGIAIAISFTTGIIVALVEELTDKMIGFMVS